MTTEYYRIFLKCTKRPDILVAGVLIPYNNVKSHKAGTVAYLNGKIWAVGASVYSKTWLIHNYAIQHFSIFQILV
jgi:hypothetical protein